MLTKIKKMMGINNDEFDEIISLYISSAKKDLKEVGIADIDDSMIDTATISYVLSLIDVQNSEMYANAYALQKDELRHRQTYTKGE